MSVVPIRRNVRYYCSDCDTHFFDHERQKHSDCCKATYCARCGAPFSAGDADECQMCGGPPENAA